MRASSRRSRRDRFTTPTTSAMPSEPRPEAAQHGSRMPPARRRSWPPGNAGSQSSRSSAAVATLLTVIRLYGHRWAISSRRASAMSLPSWAQPIFMRVCRSAGMSNVRRFIRCLAGADLGSFGWALPWTKASRSASRVRGLVEKVTCFPNYASSSAISTISATSPLTSPAACPAGSVSSTVRPSAALSAKLTRWQITVFRTPIG